MLTHHLYDMFVYLLGWNVAIVDQQSAKLVRHHDRVLIPEV